jgi:hypothetical protein
MALVGVLSTQVWHQAFCADQAKYEEETAAPMAVVDLEQRAAEAVA